MLYIIAKYKLDFNTFYIFFYEKGYFYKHSWCQAYGYIIVGRVGKVEKTKDIFNA